MQTGFPQRCPACKSTLVSIVDGVFKCRRCGYKNDKRFGTEFGKR